MQILFRKSYNRQMKPVFAVLLAAVLLLSGCGGSYESSGSSDFSGTSDATAPSASLSVSNPSDLVSASDVPYYRVTEKKIADPKAGFENAPENQEKNLVLSRTDSFSADGKAYILYNILRKEDEKTIFTGDCYLCVLEAPYERWNCYTLSADCWPPEREYYVQSIAGVGGDGVYLFMHYLNMADTFVPGYIGFYGWDGSGRILEELGVGDDLRNLALYPVDETLYAVSGCRLTTYDGQLKSKPTQNLPNQISGCFSSDSGNLWYGFFTDENLAVWDAPTGKQLFTLGNMVNAYSDFLLAKSAAGDFILADTSSIWTGKGDVPLAKVVSFSEKGYGYGLELLALSGGADRSVTLVVCYEDEFLLLVLEQSESMESQDITLVSYGASALSEVAAAFNRKSDKYNIVLVNPSDYQKDLQMEMSAGRGPDLVSPWVIDLEGCIRNGYVEPLDDIIEEPSEYWPAALENGSTEGILYGIPYRVALSFLVTSESLAGGLESWTLEQMMEAVRNSPAEALETNRDSQNIVLGYGLMTPDNPQFIDYEAGVSHLTEQPFIDFLEFAKEYGDNLYYANPGRSEASDYYLEGKLAAYSLTMNKPEDLLNARACFQGQEVLIGDPSGHGRGVRMSSDLLYLNSNSKCKEGAKEFLRFLISAEGQDLFVKNYYAGIMEYGAFPCRKDVTETVLNSFQQNKKKSKNFFYGIEVDIVPLDEEQVGQFWALFEDAQYDFPWPTEIYYIVCEELEPYFAGDCSAEEAARKMDNRVQLYLDENR